MLRIIQSKSESGRKVISIYKQAYSEVGYDGLSIRAAVKKYNFFHVSLIRYDRKTTTIEEAKVTMGWGTEAAIAYSTQNKKKLW